MEGLSSTAALVELFVLPGENILDGDGNVLFSNTRHPLRLEIFILIL